MENYWNYFTEIEECFRRSRGAPTLLSPLDWALVEAWKEAGIPLEAVLNGIERTFQKFQKRPQPYRKINTLGYCTQAVMAAAEELKTAAVESGAATSPKAEEAPFQANEIQRFLQENAGALRRASASARAKKAAVLADDLDECAASLARLTLELSGPDDLEDLERQLTALEEKVTASLTRATSMEELAKIRSEVDQGMTPYRQKMTGAQIDALQRQFIKKKLFEKYDLPRLSLFYL